MLAATAFAGSVAAGGPAAVSPAGPKVRSVVRPTSGGKLVRTIVVSPKLIPAQAVEQASETMGSSAAAIGAALEIPELVQATAKKYEVDPLLVHSVIQVESNYNPYAVSDKGAQGLMQLMPGTARRFGVSNSFDVRQNLDGGVRYLKYLQTLFPQDPRLAIAAYNAGEGAVWRYNNQIPPYRETEQYVHQVGRRYGEARRKNAAKLASATPAPAPEPVAAEEPRYTAVESYVDAQGLLHLRSASQ